MLLRKRFVPAYLLSLAVGFCFGELLEFRIGVLPKTLPFRVAYFAVSYLVICFGVALFNHCKILFVPTELFLREVSAITGVTYARIKVPFDLRCLVVTALLAGIWGAFWMAWGAGTVLAALIKEKVIGQMNRFLDQKAAFKSLLEKYAELEALQKRIHDRIKAILGIEIRVSLVEPKSLERFTGKAQRVVDLRQK